MKQDMNLAKKINDLKSEHRAVILAHNYQRPEVQDIADFCGDSLELSVKAKESPAEEIVFCGVHFMAETAALLSPEKTVLLPDENAGCPMADMAHVDDLAHVRNERPEAIVVCYVNSSAAVKAHSDVCCTSANAVSIVSRIPPDKPILFVPDQNLGRYVERMTGRKLDLWPGYCSVHTLFEPEHIQQARAAHPEAAVIVHPECREVLIDLADEALSTGGMCRFAAQTDKKTVIVGTETGLLHRLRKENPEKQFIPLSEQAVCPNMKLTTLERVEHALSAQQTHIRVGSDIAEPARRAIAQMLDDGPIVRNEDYRG